MKKYVPDTSAIIEGILSEKVRNNEIKGEIIIPHAVIHELEYQANRGRSSGLVGLSEVLKLRELSSKKKIFELKFAGEFPKDHNIKYARSGAMDDLIRQEAVNHNAIFVTADRVQAETAKALGIKVIFYEGKEVGKSLLIEKYFDENTMSIHLKEGVEPFAKIGVPGKWIFQKLKDKKLTMEELEKIYKDILEKTKVHPEAFIETERRGSSIIQYKDYRIVITKKPFSDGWEITAVHPIKELELKEYHLTSDVLQRITLKAEGILVAGAPGMGKSTFITALAKEYLKEGRIIKTIETPRDLKLPPEVTQYSKNIGSDREIHDVILLSRPDFVFFDEMRDTPDFKLYADLRLSGVGMTGVVHATSPIDAIQRFIKRIELGMIPNIIDTVIFIDNGIVSKIFEVSMTVRVPSGMTERDLARPVIEVRDFKTNDLEFEIYTYGEETIVYQVRKSPKKKIQKTKRYEEELKYDIEMGKNVITFWVDKKFSGSKAHVKLDGSEIFTHIISRKGNIRINTKTQLGKQILRVVKHDRNISMHI